MTISSAIATATLAWTGVETSFTPGFQAQNASDVSVVYASTVLTETLVLGTNYSVALDGAGNVTVIPIALPAAPATLTISRNSSLLQIDSFADGEPWSAETIGQALDLCALRDQELRRDVKPATTFAGLTDVQITEGSSINGFVPSWSDAIKRWVAVANGGGGGGGGSFVTTLTALAASNPSAGALQLVAGGRSGLFAWVAGNFATQVANDPSRAIYVAWSGDSAPGASGAWVRSASTNPLQAGWFGFLCDGTTDNHQSWLWFGTYARWQSTLGNAVVINFPPGICQFDLSQCYYALFNISVLKIIGYGTKFQATAPLAGNAATLPWFSASQPLRGGDGSNTNKNWFINQTTPSAMSFTTTTPADVNNLADTIAAGGYVMLGSISMQTGGFPQNLHRFEFVQPLTINASTGVVTVDRPLRYTHLASFPDDLPNAGIGAARVWLMDTPGWSTRKYPNNSAGAPFYPMDIVRWNVQHFYEGFQVLGAINNVGTEVLLQAYSIKTRNCTFGDVATQQSTVDTVSFFNSHEDNQYLFGYEVDKLVNAIEFKRCKFPFSTLPQGVQSGSIESILYDDCELPSGVAAGAKATKYDQCRIGAGANGSNFSGPVYGLAYSMEVTGCRVYGGYKKPGFADDAQPLGIDSNVTYANGVFSCLIGSAFYGAWCRLVPGQQIYLATAVNTVAYAGDIGMGYVTGISKSGTNWVITTTLAAATLPSWATHGAAVVAGPSADIRDSSGSYEIEVVSRGNKKGYKPHEYYDLRFVGNIWPPTGFTAGGPNASLFNMMGILQQINVNVLQAFTGAGSGNIILQFTAYDNTALTSLGAINVTIDVTRVGKRTITQATATTVGLGGADVLSVYGATPGALPTNGQLGNIWGWRFSYSQGAFADRLMPNLSIEIITDCGGYKLGVLADGHS